jgi:hypothetical protein
VYWQLSDTSELETEHTLLGKRHLDEPTKSKKYCAFMHFSRYVRPGAVRIGAMFGNGDASIGGKSEFDTFRSLNVSAFLHENDRTLTVVLINMRDEDQKVRVRVPADLGVERWSVHLTSARHGFTEQPPLDPIDEGPILPVPALSALTLHARLMP